MTIGFTTHLHLEKIDFNRVTWHDAMNGNFDIMDAAINASIGLTGISGIWTNLTTYIVGEKVIDSVGNVVFRCLFAHTSDAVNTFAQDRIAHPTYWAPQDVGFSIRGAWVTGTAYVIGDMIYETTEHVVLVCTAAHTSGVLRTDMATKWATVADLKDDVLTAHANADDAQLYSFATSVVDADPGAGIFRLNNAFPSSASAMYIDNVNAEGATSAIIIDLWDDSTTTNKGLLTIRSKQDSTIRHTWQVTGTVVDGTGYRKVTIAYVAGSGTFTAGMACYIMFNRYGDAGPAGAGTGDVLAANNGTDYTAATFRTNLSLYSKAEIDAYAFGRTAKTTLVTADTINVTDSAAANVDKKITWGNFSELIRGLFFNTNKVPVDADIVPIADSVLGYLLPVKYVTFTQIKALFKTYFDTLYAAIGHTHTFASLTAKPTTVAGYGITDVTSYFATVATGAVGSYAWLRQNTAAVDIVEGTSYAGANLTYSGGNTNSGAPSTGLGGTPAGTWKAMAHSDVSGAVFASGLFLRIA